VVNSGVQLEAEISFSGLHIFHHIVAPVVELGVPEEAVHVRVGALAIVKIPANVVGVGGAIETLAGLALAPWPPLVEGTEIAPPPPPAPVALRFAVVLELVVTAIVLGLPRLVSAAVAVLPGTPPGVPGSGQLAAGQKIAALDPKTRIELEHMVNKAGQRGDALLCVYLLLHVVVGDKEPLEHAEGLVPGEGEAARLPQGPEGHLQFGHVRHILHVVVDS